MGGFRSWWSRRWGRPREPRSATPDAVTKSELSSSLANAASGAGGGDGPATIMIDTSDLDVQVHDLSSPLRGAEAVPYSSVVMDASISRRLLSGQGLPEGPESFAISLDAADLTDVSPEEAAQLRSVILKFESSTGLVEGRPAKTMRSNSVGPSQGIGVAPGPASGLSGFSEGTSLSPEQRAAMLARIAEMAGDVPPPAEVDTGSFTVSAEYTPVAAGPVVTGATPTRVGRMRPVAAKRRSWRWLWLTCFLVGLAFALYAYYFESYTNPLSLLEGGAFKLRPD